MPFDSQKHHRRSIRLPGYDYAAGGAYFVTVCAADKRCVFGKMESNAVRLHPYGCIVEACWRALPEHFPNLALDEHIVMPNHFHGIVFITAELRVDVGAQHAAPLRHNNHVAAGSLAAIVRSFKSAVTRHINIHRAEHGLSPAVVWQRNYYERIIRDETELDNTRRYIIENPLYWENDEHRLTL